MTKEILLLMLFLALPLAYAQCIEPSDGMVINENTVFCEGKYSLMKGLSIGSSGIKLDCNSAEITCLNSIEIGINVVEENNVIIKNCRILNCQNGINLIRSHNNAIVSNTLLENNIGIALQSSNDNKVVWNVLINNTDSMYSINSVVDKEEILSNNEYDIEPVIREIVEKVEEEDGEVRQEAAGAVREEFTEIVDESAAEEILREVIEIENGGVNEKDIKEKVYKALARYSEDQQKIDIKRIFEFNGSATKITIEITPKEKLYNLSYYELIPKCLALYLNEIVFLNKDFRILKDDPLIVWYFAEIEEKVDLSYTVDKKIPDYCKKLLKGIGITEDLVIESEVVEEEKTYLIVGRLVLAILLVPIIAFVLIYFSIFRIKR
jgi:parallel beta-helix repeat protein